MSDEDRAAKGYQDKREYTCVCCGGKVLLTKFASAKTAKCEDCKVRNKPVNPDLVAQVSQKSKAPSAPAGETKICKCIDCGADVEVTKFASALKVLCPKCKGEGGGISIQRKLVDVDEVILDSLVLPHLDEYYVAPEIISNPMLRDITCPSCETKHMKIIKIIDNSDRGAVVTYQCSNKSCLLLMTISEQATGEVSPVKQHEIFNYRGELINQMISAKTDTVYRNAIEHLMKLLADHNIEVEGLPVPSMLRPSDRKNNKGLITNQIDQLLVTLSQMFRNATRVGGNTDDPEGTQYIHISDTLANQIADQLDKYIKIWKGSTKDGGKENNTEESSKVQEVPKANGGITMG